MTTGMKPQSKIPYNCYLLDRFGKPTVDLSKGDLYISVSSVLKMEGKELVPWALRKFGNQENPFQAYQSFMDEVASLGSRIHRYVECDLKGTPLSDKEIQPDMLPAISAWHEFKEKSSLKMIASERIVSSHKWKVAGTLDLVIEINGKLYIADLKTGSVYPSGFTQMAAYRAMLREEKKPRRIPGIERADLLLINLHRDGKPVELHTLDSYYDGCISIEDEVGVFHALRYLWAKRNLSTQKWNPIIKTMKEVFSPLEERFRESFLLPNEPNVKDQERKKDQV